MSVLSLRSWSLWCLGYPDAALADADRALGDAREIGQAATLMYALGIAAPTYLQCGNYAQASAMTDELVSLAEEKGALHWGAIAIVNRGLLAILKGTALEAVQMLTLASLHGGQLEERTGSHCIYRIYPLPVRSWVNSMTLCAALAKR